MKTFKRTTIESYKIWKNGEYSTISLDYDEKNPTSGELIVASSYGTWSYHFGSMGKPMKNFLTGISKDYLRGKLLLEDSYVFDPDKTKTEIIEWVQTLNDEDEEFKKELIEHVKEIYCCDSEIYFFEELKHGPFSDLEYDFDLHEFRRSKPNPVFDYFWDELWTYFIENLKEELE